MKQKLLKPPLIHIDMNEVINYKVNKQHEGSFSSALNQQGQKEGVFANSPTPNFISPSNKQHKQQNKSGIQFFSKQNQRQNLNSQNKSYGHIQVKEEKILENSQKKYYEIRKQSKEKLASKQQVNTQIKESNQMVEYIPNKENFTKRNSCSPNMVDNYYKRIQQFNEFVKNKNFISYMNKSGLIGGCECHHNTQQLNKIYQDYQQLELSNEMKLSPKSKQNQGLISELRLKQIAKSTRSLARNSSSSNVTVQPQRISVDMSEFMVKKPHQLLIQGEQNINLQRQSTPLQNIYIDFNEQVSNNINLTPQNKYINTSSSKSPTHKVTKSLIDFIKNGISNSTKNVNRYQNDNSKMLFCQDKSNKLNQIQSQKLNSKVNERNFNSLGRNDYSKSKKVNQSLTNLKSNNYNNTNRSTVSTTAHSVTPLTSPDMVGVNTLNKSQQDKHLKVRLDKHPLSTKASQQNNSNTNDHYIQRTSFSTKNSSSCYKDNDQNGFLNKNNTNIVTIKQNVLLDRLQEKQMQKQEIRFATETDQIHEEDDEFIQEESTINKILDQQQIENAKQNQNLKQQQDFTDEDYTSSSYRTIMTASGQIAKEHPTPSKIKYLQSNQKNRYFDKPCQEEILCSIEKYEKECTNRTQIFTNVGQPKFQFSPLKNQYVINAPQNIAYSENLEESFQAQHNCHSVQKVQSQLGVNGLIPSQDHFSNQINSLPFTQDSTKYNSNYQSNHISNNITLPNTVINDSIQQRNSNNQQLNPERVYFQYNQDHQESEINKLNESKQTNSEKHLMEQYPLKPENNTQADKKELEVEKKNILESQYEFLYKNQQKQSSTIPITNMNPQFTENNLLQSSSNRILSQLQDMQNKKTFQNKQQKYESENKNSEGFFQQINKNNADNEQSLMIFQNSQDELNSDNLTINRQKIQQCQYTQMQYTNNDMNELSFEAKNIDNSQKLLPSSIESNTINSIQNLNYFNLISSNSQNNISSSYIYNNGMNTPKQNQNKQLLLKMQNHNIIPKHTQAASSEELFFNKNFNQKENSPPNFQYKNRVSIHQISPTSNKKLNQLIQQREASQSPDRNSLTNKQNLTQNNNQHIFQLGQNNQNNNHIIDQINQNNQNIYQNIQNVNLQDQYVNIGDNIDYVTCSMSSAPYQNYSQNQSSQLNYTNQTQNNRINNNENNQFQETFSLFNQQTSLTTDRSSVILTAQKQSQSSQPLQFYTSQCSSYRIDPLYQQQLNQYNNQKSTYSQINPEKSEINKQNTVQSIFDSQQQQTKQNNINGQYYDEFKQQNHLTKEKITDCNSQQQIGSQMYQNQFFHPIDINIQQNYPFNVKYNSNSNGQQNQNLKCQQQNQNNLQQNQVSLTSNQINKSQIQTNENLNKNNNNLYNIQNSYEQHYLMQRLQQVKQQQQLQQSQSISQKQIPSEIDISKIERSFNTTTEELGVELQDNKTSTNKLLQHLNLLQNRIKKLVNEDENLEKRLACTAQRKEEMIIIKMKHHEDNIRLQTLKQRQQEQIKDMKGKISQSRMQSRERLEKSKIQSQMQKKQIANQIKETSSINKSLLDESRNLDLLKNSFIISSIKYQEKKLVDDKYNKAVNAQLQSKVNQLTKIDHEKEQQEQIKEKIKEYENMEQQLIQNLEQKYEQNKSLLYI